MNLQCMIFFTEIQEAVFRNIGVWASSETTLRYTIFASYVRGDEWSIKFFNCSQNFTFARFARKI